MTRCAWWNLGVPGAGLVLRGRLVVGLVSLVLAVMALSGAVLAQLIVVSGSVWAVTGWCVAAYVAIGCATLATHVVLERVPEIDPEHLRRQHREITIAFLQGDLAAALTNARALTRSAAGEPGAWRLCELIARHAGDKAQATSAGRTARTLELRREEQSA